MKWAFWIDLYIRTHCVARGLRPLTLVAYENTLKQFTMPRATELPRARSAPGAATPLQTALRLQQSM